MIEAEAVSLRNSVLVGGVGGAFDDSGQPTNLASDAALTVMKDDVAWWAEVLNKARADGQLLLFAPDHSHQGVTPLPGCDPYSLMTIEVVPDLATWIETCATAWRD